MCWTWSSRTDHRGIHLTGKFWSVTIYLHISLLFSWYWHFLHVLQYLSRFINTKWQIFDRFAVMFSVAIVWLFAQILTSSGVYDNKPASTQMSCRTDRSGLLAASPWWDFSLVYANYDCQQVISVTVSWISLTAVDLLVLWFCHKHAGYIFHIHFNGEAPLSMQEKLLQWLLPL